MSLTSSNISKFYIWSFLSSFSFIYTIFAIYFFGRGISFSELAIFASATIIFSSLFEIPTGFIADKYSRKLSVSLGFLFEGLVFAAFIFINNIEALIIASVFKGLATALRSGATEALIYDELKSQNKEATFIKVTSRGSTIGTVSGAIATLLGPLLFVVHFALPFLLTSAAYIISSVLVLFFREEKVSHEAENQLKIIDGIKKIVRVKPLMIIVGIEALVLIFVNIYFQVLFFPKVNQLGLDIRYLGVLDVITVILMTLSLLILPKIVFKSDKKNLIFYTLTVCACFIIFGLTNQLITALLFGVLFDLIWTARKHVIPNILNKFFDSRERALGISSMNLISGVASAVLIPISAYLFTISYYFAFIPAIIIALLLFMYPKRLL